MKTRWAKVKKINIKKRCLTVDTDVLIHDYFEFPKTDYVAKVTKVKDGVIFFEDLFGSPKGAKEGEIFHSIQ